MSIIKTNDQQGATQVATIASGGTTSDAIYVGDYEMGSFAIPSAFTDTGITVHGSVDGTNFEAIRNNANAAIAEITVAVNGQYVLPAEAFRYRYIELVSGASEGAERQITVFLKG